jgi:hypothetical protein
MSKTFFSPDIIEFLYLLFKHKVYYLIIGGEAVIYYGNARLTGDIDIFYECDRENISRLYKMLNEFWSDNIPGLNSKEELLQKGTVFQFGVPPNRIDLMNVIESIEFKNAWVNKKEDIISHKKKEFKIFYIGLNDLIKNKMAVNRFKDKDDLKFLQELEKKKKYKNKK